MLRRTLPVVLLIALVMGAMLTAAPGATAAKRSTAGSRTKDGLIIRPRGASSVAQPWARAGTAGARGAPSTTCSTPGGSNWMTDCHSTGRAVNETSIAFNGTTLVAGANDYNSYNGQAQAGYYQSADGKQWTDKGPIDIFAHGSDFAAGDPGLAIDPAGVVYYSAISFSYSQCAVGGVELMRRNPSTQQWGAFQLKANTQTRFQDKPAIAIDGSNVYVAWAEFHSCFGSQPGPSPILVAISPLGSNPVPPTTRLAVPGSIYSEGASIGPDGAGGFWIAWEEFTNPSMTTGRIQLAHWDQGTGWSTPTTISPPGFTNLPSPLIGFAFRDNSFPVLAVASGGPKVAWTSYDSGVGRAYLWSNGSVRLLDNHGDDQFFPSIVASGSRVSVSFSQTRRTNQSYDQYLVRGRNVTKVTTASSFPNQDPFFGGAFIGDYNGMTLVGVSAVPIWTDVRGTSFAQNAMVFFP